jgi:hypothetical protein
LWGCPPKKEPINFTIFTLCFDTYSEANNFHFFVINLQYSWTSWSRTRRDRRKILELSKVRLIRDRLWRQLFYW